MADAPTERRPRTPLPRGGDGKPPVPGGGQPPARMPRMPGGRIAFRRWLDPSNFSLDAANKGMETSQAEGFALEASYFGICAATEDKKEGTSAFLQKRAPQFHGR